jgi:hypothetical protein
MNTIYYQQIAKSTAHRKSRDTEKNFIFENPSFLNDLVAISLLTNDKNHHKACWILELICEEQLELFIPYITEFCKTLKHHHSDSAIRSVSKIGMFLVKSKNINLTEEQEELIIETYLDWLINSNKAANAAYTMRTLYLLSKKHRWVKEELRFLLERNCSHQTVGYQFAVEDILKKL